MYRLRLSRIMQSSLDSFFKGKRPVSKTAGNAESSAKHIKKENAEIKVKNVAESLKPPSQPPAPKPAALSASSANSDSSTSSVMYSEITNVFSQIEATTKRLEITKLVADLFTSIIQKTHASPPKLAQAVYLCINKLGPDYEGLELGLGESLIMKSLSESSGRQTSDIKKQLAKLGDLGQVAEITKGSQALMFSKPKPLTVDFVFNKLKEIAKSTGKESQQKKINIIKGLLLQCQNSEAKYLVRSLEGKLRIGLAEQTVLTALNKAFQKYDEEQGRAPVDGEEGEESIKNAFSQVPNYTLIIEAAFESGLGKLSEAIKITPGVPLKPMLAKPTKSVTEILDRFKDKQFTCEYKYDGERAQVHSVNGKMYVYSRNMEDMTQRYPDLVEVLPKISSPGVDFVLDCEAVAWDHENSKILPFQVLSTRKRKDVLNGDIKVRVQLFAFDLLFYNGESYLSKPLRERRQTLREKFVETPGEFSLAKSTVTSEIEDIQTFLDKSISDNCEGLMIKSMDGYESKYEPSKRSLNWLKLKKDYLDGIGDTIDLVVVGAYFGKGKRTNVFGGFLLASYNTDTEEYETVCKIGTGFSDAVLQQMYATLFPLGDKAAKSYIVHDPNSNIPDLWFEPKYVWEVLTADLSLSPVYQAGKSDIDDNKGVSLRFPRFIRERDDKGPEDCTSSQQLVEMYYAQFRK